MQPDDEVTKRYRAIAREEPSASMDAAILAASRRAVRPSLSRRWGAPVSIAAVLVLAFGLTLEMRHEEPGIESSVPTRPSPPGEPPGPAATPTPAPGLQAVPADKDSLTGAPQRAAAPAERKKERAREDASPVSRAQKIETPVQEQFLAKPALEPRAERDAPAAFPASPAAPAAAQSAPAPQRAPAADMNVAPAPAPAARAKAMSGAAALRVAPAPVEAEPEAATRELERIAGLRAAGRDVEADKALEDFRRDHPGYRIPEAMWERVRPR